MYSAELGRFLQTDPIGYFDSMNLYQYCRNNPVNFVDPLGLCKGWKPDWNEVIVGIGEMFWGAFQFLGGSLLTQGDSPMIGPLDIIGVGIALNGIGDIGLGYGHLLGGLTGTDTSDLPTSMINGVVDTITGNDDAGDVAEDIYNTGTDHFLGISPP